jgi:hypothetical protein
VSVIKVISLVGVATARASSQASVEGGMPHLEQQLLFCESLAILYTLQVLNHYARELANGGNVACKTSTRYSHKRSSLHTALPPGI